MPCASCGQQQVAPVERKAFQNFTSPAVPISAGPCNYTLDQLKVWFDKLNCFKQKGIYVQYGIRPADLNRALGNVLSAINYSSNICYFQRQLDIVQPIIMIVINSGQC